MTLAGRYYQVRDAVLHPPPDRPIPILVAAKGRRMLWVTARSADAWNTACPGYRDRPALRIKLNRRWLGAANRSPRPGVLPGIRADPIGTALHDLGMPSQREQNTV